MTESQRALKVMGVFDAEQRRSPRRSVHTGGTISAGDATHVAWIKDINESGICFFTKHCPSVGESVRITLQESRLPSHVHGEYSGTVIRVQMSSPGAAVGVAVRFHGIVTRRMRAS
jgi:hypothetical protein